MVVVVCCFFGGATKVGRVIHVQDLLSDQDSCWCLLFFWEKQRRLEE